MWKAARLPRTRLLAGLVTSALVAAVVVAAAPLPPRGSATWPDRAQWAQLRCDLAGIDVPAIAPYGRTSIVSSWIYPIYPPAVRAQLRAAMKARGYTHLVIDNRPKYRDHYPTGDFLDRPAEFRAMLAELLDAGLMPVVFLVPDDIGIDRKTTPEQAIAILDQKLSRFMADRAMVNLIKVASVGWEIDGWMSPATAEAVTRWLRERLSPDALLFVHFTPEKVALALPGESEASWWRRMAGESLVDGILYQHDGRRGPRSLQSALETLVASLHRGANGWPTRTGRGGPLHVVAFEYAAQWEKAGTLDEARAIELGEASLQVEGVAGFCDGGR